MRTSPRSFSARLSIRFAVAATALAGVALLAQHSDPAPGSQSDVGHQRWALSNPRLREYAVRQLPPTKPKPTPSTTPTSGAPTGGPSGTPTTSPSTSSSTSSSTSPSTSPSGVPSSDAPTSDAPSSDTPTSDAPTSDAPSSDAPSSDAPTDAPFSDAPTSDTPTSDAPTTPDPSASQSSGDTVINANTAMPTSDLADWKLTFVDDFNGTSLNRGAWQVYGNNPIPSEPVSGYWATNHAVVANSMLTLKGYRDSAVSPDGRIVTGGVKLAGWQAPAQTYGKYETLVRIDSCKDVKYAFLLWPESGVWPRDGEIDFAEDAGGNRATTTGTVTYPGTNQREILPQVSVTPTIPMSGWHVLGVEWTPGMVQYTIDGRVWGTTTSPTWIPHVPMNFVMQTESVTPAKQVPDSFSSCDAQIAWVAQWAMR